MDVSNPFHWRFEAVVLVDENRFSAGGGLTPCWASTGRLCCHLDRDFQGWSEQEKKKKCGMDASLVVIQIEAVLRCKLIVWVVDGGDGCC